MHPQHVGLKAISNDQTCGTALVVPQFRRSLRLLGERLSLWQFVHLHCRGSGPLHSLNSAAECPKHSLLCPLHHENKESYGKQCIVQSCLRAHSMLVYVSHLLHRLLLSSQLPRAMPQGAETVCEGLYAASETKQAACQCSESSVVSLHLRCGNSAAYMQTARTSM